MTMTTSLTDARYNSLHFTPQQLIALHIDPDPETGWGVMPGYDQTIPIPQHLEPPITDADETLPSLMHPSYPFGRPATKGRGRDEGKGKRKGPGVGDVLGMMMRGERWEEVGIREVLEREKKKEVPPGMAGAKRPPSPPSPSLHPSQDPQPRSEHLRNLYQRQRQSTPTHETDPFDAPLPNELFEEGQEGQEGHSLDMTPSQGQEGGGGPGGSFAQGVEEDMGDLGEFDMGAAR